MIACLHAYMQPGFTVTKKQNRKNTCLVQYATVNPAGNWSYLWSLHSILVIIFTFLEKFLIWRVYLTYLTGICQSVHDAGAILYVIM